LNFVIIMARREKRKEIGELREREKENITILNELFIIYNKRLPVNALDQLIDLRATQREMLDMVLWRDSPYFRSPHNIFAYKGVEDVITLLWRYLDIDLGEDGCANLDEVVSLQTRLLEKERKLIEELKKGI
jgi:hypothetical protein